MAIYTKEMYTALVQSIAMGVTKVKYGDKETEYRSLNDMIRIKSLMEADLGMTSLNKRKRYASHTKGIQ